MHKSFPMMTSELDLFYADQQAAHRRAALERMRPRRSAPAGSGPAARVAVVCFVLAALAVSVTGGWGAPVGASETDRCEASGSEGPGCRMLQGRADGWFVPAP